MSSDLLFPILPREGKVPMSHDEQKVQKVSKEASLRSLNDEEKALNAEERDAREKYQSDHQKDKKSSAQSNVSTDDADQDNREDKDSPPHLDIYV